MPFSAIFLPTITLPSKLLLFKVLKSGVSLFKINPHMQHLYINTTYSMQRFVIVNRNVPKGLIEPSTGCCRLGIASKPICQLDDMSQRTASENADEILSS